MPQRLTVVAMGSVTSEVTQLDLAAAAASSMASSSAEAAAAATTSTDLALAAAEMRRNTRIADATSDASGSSSM